MAESFLTVSSFSEGGKRFLIMFCPKVLQFQCRYFQGIVLKGQPQKIFTAFEMLLQECKGYTLLRNCHQFLHIYELTQEKV
jgi:hypothetical protein